MKKWITKLSTMAVSFFLLQTPAHAALNLILTQGVSGAVPIAVVPFAGQENLNANDPTNIAAVISTDLKNSGRFQSLDASKMSAMPHDDSHINYADWKALKQNDVVVGKISSVGSGQVQISFELLDAYKGNPPLLNQQLTVSSKDLHRAAHHISDLIYQTLTGERGIFSTRLAYVLVQRNPNQATRYALEVSDADGYNPQAILSSTDPVMSPAWSHDGNKIAYVSLENLRSQIYVSDVATGNRTLISAFPGINGAPAWSPDNTKLAMVLSKTGNPKIYVMNLASKQLTQLTTGNSIDTEPSWSPDGQSLLFTSDRGGSPQIYQVTLGSNQVQRVSYNGNYNARASYSPDGQQIVMLHQEGGFGIGLQDLQTGAFITLDNSGDDQSPSFAPNGEMIVYATRSGSQRQLAVVSTDGKIKLRLPSDQGDVQEPVWSPFLN
jgi:TolB protein